MTQAHYDGRQIRITRRGRETCRPRSGRSACPRPRECRCARRPAVHASRYGRGKRSASQASTTAKMRAASGIAVALEAARVAGAVPPLVVAVGDVERRAEELDRREQLVGELGVPAHDDPTPPRERTRLEQDAVGNAHLADVVQEHTAADVHEVVRADTHRPRQPRRQLRDARRVAVGLAVAQLERARPALEGRVVRQRELRVRSAGGSRTASGCRSAIASWPARVSRKSSPLGVAARQRRLKTSSTPWTLSLGDSRARQRGPEALLDERPPRRQPFGAAPDPTLPRPARRLPRVLRCTCRLHRLVGDGLEAEPLAGNRPSKCLAGSKHRTTAASTGAGRRPASRNTSSAFEVAAARDVESMERSAARRSSWRWMRCAARSRSGDVAHGRDAHRPAALGSGFPCVSTGNTEPSLRTARCS